MPTSVEKFIFFPTPKRVLHEGITVLRDGRQVTDPDVLIQTPEFEEHLEEVRETVKDYVESRPDSNEVNGQK